MIHSLLACKRFDPGVKFGFKGDVTSRSIVQPSRGAMEALYGSHLRDSLIKTMFEI